MKKVILFSIFLLVGLFLSQFLPPFFGESYTTVGKVTKVLMFICLAYIMINVGREFDLDKKKWRSYAVDYFIAMAKPFCRTYFCGNPFYDACSGRVEKSMDIQENSDFGNFRRPGYHYPDDSFANPDDRF